MVMDGMKSALGIVQAEFIWGWMCIIDTTLLIRRV